MNRKDELAAKYHANGKYLPKEEAKEFTELTRADQISDGLLDKVLNGETLNTAETKALNSYIDRYIAETVSGKTLTGRQMVAPASQGWALHHFKTTYLSDNYAKDYHFPYGGTNNQKNKAVNELPAERTHFLGLIDRVTYFFCIKT